MTDVTKPAATVAAAPGATGAVAAGAVGVRFEDLPGEVVTVAKQCVLDALGVAVAGAGEPAVTIVRDAVCGDAPAGPSVLVGVGGTARPVDAAMVNGTSAHALDYDDVSAVMGGHPSAPVLPAVLALAEQLGASGRALLAAFVAGFEVECRVGEAVGPDHYERGFHTTATVGTFGAAAGCSRLLGTGPARAEAALGIAATQAAGLKSMFGTMCKPLQVGKAAANGLLAAELTARGFTSAADGLACPQGFAATQTNAFDPEPTHASFGSPWHILDVLFKVHASCYLTHACIEAALTLRDEIGDPAEVERIVLTVSPGHLTVCNIARPRTGLEGKFSLRLTTALALATGATGESEFTDEKVTDPRLAALCARTEVVVDESMPRYAGAVTLFTRDGRTLRAEADSGSPAWADHPSEQAPRLIEKFDALAAPVVGGERAALLADAVAHLEDVTDVRSLAALTVPAERTA
ncbi:MAG: MmgE/PrpD family protein [Streptosporangiaceae bacterium]